MWIKGTKALTTKMWIGSEGRTFYARIGDWLHLTIHPYETLEMSVRFFDFYKVFHVKGNLDLTAEEMHMIESGRLLSTIAKYKGRTGVDLYQAKNVCRAYYNKVHPHDNMRRV